MDLYITDPVARARSAFDRQVANIARLEGEIAQHDAKHGALARSTEEGAPRTSLERSHDKRDLLVRQLKDARISHKHAKDRLDEEVAKANRAAAVAAEKRLRELAKRIVDKAGVVEQQVASLAGHFQELSPLINELGGALPGRGIEAEHAFNALGPGGLVGALMNHMARSGIPTVPLTWGPTSVPTFRERIVEQVAVAMKSVGE